MRPLRSAASALVADVAATALSIPTAHAAKPPEASAFDRTFLTHGGDNDPNFAQHRWARLHYAQEAA